MNPYKILGIRRNARAETIRKAYREKSKQAHPDAGGSPEAFDALKTARDVLLDPDRRKVFDETGRIDPAAPDNDVSSAMAILSQLLSQVIQDDRDPFKVDLVGSMAASLDKGIDGIAAQLAKLKRSRDRVEKMKGRFSRKKGENAMEGMLDWQGAQIARAIAQTEAALRHHRKAAEIIKDYEFRKDPEQVRQAFIQFGNTFSSSASATGW